LGSVFLQVNEIEVGRFLLPWQKTAKILRFFKLLKEEAKMLSFFSFSLT
jgi:hypothetical protein